MDTKSIGKQIKTARLQNNLTQQQFAEQINMSTTYISAIEQGAKTPKLETFIKIANALDVSADFLLSDVVKSAFPVKASLLSEQLEDLSEWELKLIGDVITVMKENFLLAKTDFDKD